MTIVRTVDGIEWEIPINYKVDSVYHGSGSEDDPSEVHVNEKATVTLETGPFKENETIILTEAERDGFAEDEYNEICDEAENPY